MKKASWTLLLLLFSSCGGDDRSAMLAPSPAARASAQSFAASIQATLVPAAAPSEFARCLQDAGDSACFNSSRVHTQGTTGSAIIAAPSNLSATANDSSVTLTWAAPLATFVSSYTIEAGSSAGLSNLANFSTGNAQTSFSASGVGAGTYYVRIRAVSTSGEISAASNEAVLVVGGSGPCVAPTAPSSLVIASVTGGTVVLTWNAASGSPASYIVEAGSGPGLSNLANNDLGLTTTLTATGVGAGTYYVRIRAKNTCGMSGPSNEVVLTVSGATGPRTSFGAGQYLIGRDIAAGRYYSVPSYGCYWERQSGLGGTLLEIIANDFIGFNAGQWIVDILSSDLAFQTKTACGTWFNTPRQGAQTTISQGMWLVGSQVGVGTYRASVQSGCYWERLSDFTGNLSGIIANNFVSSAGPQFVTIGAGDAGFDTNASCGSWTRVAALTETTATPSGAQIEQNRAMGRSQNWPSDAKH